MNEQKTGGSEMDQEEEHIEFKKFNAIGDTIEGKVLEFVTTNSSPAILCEDNEGKQFFLPVGTISLKRLFKNALTMDLLKEGTSTVCVKWLEEVPIKDSTNTFNHYELSGWTNPKEKSSYFKFDSRQKVKVNKTDFQKFLGK